MISYRALGLVLGSVALLAAGAGVAAETPHSGQNDHRVRFIAYDPDDVTEIVGVIRSTTEIVFGPDETVDKVAIGDSKAWQVAPVRNIVFLKPQALFGPTNMVVLTILKDGSTRSYNFELVDREGDIDQKESDAMFQIRFRYPLDEEAAARRLEREREQERERTLAETKLEAAPAQGPLNWSYTVQGSSELAPVEAYDNGKVTTLAYPENQPIPAIFTILPDGQESRIEYSVDGKKIIIHGVVPELRFRRGKATASLYNRAYDPLGYDPGTGTISTQVRRSIAPAPPAPPAVAPGKPN